MKLARDSVGPRGLAVLGIAAVLGIVLAVHGWSTRHQPTALGSIGHRSSVTAPPAEPSQSSATTPSTGASPASTPGPLLSSQSYAQYAFQIWPGQPNTAAKTAETGLTITVRSRTGGIEVTAGVSGQPAGAPQFYPAGVRVYVIEATLGDDSGNTDYNLGDDGLVVTDAHGRIVT